MAHLANKKHLSVKLLQNGYVQSKGAVFEVAPLDRNIGKFLYIVSHSAFHFKPKFQTNNVVDHPLYYFLFWSLLWSHKFMYSCLSKSCVCGFTNVILWLQMAGVWSPSLVKSINVCLKDNVIMLEIV